MKLKWSFRKIVRPDFSHDDFFDIHNVACFKQACSCFNVLGNVGFVGVITLIFSLVPDFVYSGI